MNLQHQIRIHNLLYLKELLKLQKEFDKRKIKVVHLKGILLSDLLYKKLPHYLLSDIDILINPKSFPKLKKALILHGYAQKIDPFKPHYWNQNELPEQTFSKRENKIQYNIDVHQILIWPTRPPFDLFPRKTSEQFTSHCLKNVQIQQFHSQSFLVLANEELLLYICLNLFFHHVGRGKHLLYNVATITKKQRINWKRFKDLVNKYNCDSSVYFPLFWATKCNRAKISKNILISYKPKQKSTVFVHVLINNNTIAKPLLPKQAVTISFIRHTLCFLLYKKPLWWKITRLLEWKSLKRFGRFIELVQINQEIQKSSYNKKQKRVDGNKKTWDIL